MALSIIELATQFPAVKNSTAAHLAKPLSGCLAHQLLSGDKFVVVQSNQTFLFDVGLPIHVSELGILESLRASILVSPLRNPRRQGPPAQKHDQPFGQLPLDVSPCGLGRFSGRLAQRASAGSGFHCPVPCGILPIDLPTPRSRIVLFEG